MIELGMSIFISIIILFTICRPNFISWKIFLHIILGDYSSAVVPRSETIRIIIAKRVLITILPTNIFIIIK